MKKFVFEILQTLGYKGCLLDQCFVAILRDRCQCGSLPLGVWKSFVPPWPCVQGNMA